MKKIDWAVVVSSFLGIVFLGFAIFFHWIFWGGVVISLIFSQMKLMGKS